MAKLTVIIPVKNGAFILDKCLKSIREQSLKDVDILILDSGSKDESKSIAANYNCTIIDVEPSSFNHGETRNEGAKLAGTELVFFTVQDAWVSNETVLSRMCNWFDDPAVMGVTGHQAIPYGEKDKNPAYWFKPVSEPIPEIRHFTAMQEFQQLSAAKKFEFSSWDDVVAMYRRSALEQIPFTKTNFSEDWLWAQEALGKGFKLVRDPGLVVYHYHHMLFNYSFKTKFIIAYHFYIYFQHITKIPWSLMPLVKATYRILKNEQLSLPKKLSWVIHNISMSFAIFLSVVTFRLSLSLGGDKLLMRAYRYICPAAPQGISNIKPGKI